MPDLQPDTTLCLEDEGPIWVDVSQPGVAYLWSTGADQPGALLSEPGCLFCHLDPIGQWVPGFGQH